MKIATSAGHSYACDGASGCGYSEHNEAVKLNAAFVALCKRMGVDAADCTSEKATVSGYLDEQVAKSNASGADVAIQWHFNCASGNASGCEAIYYEGNNEGRRLASDVAKALSVALGLPNRGAKDTCQYGSSRNLQFLNATWMVSIIIETCFIDNRKDMDAYELAFNKVVEEVFTAITGIEVEEKPMEPVARPEAQIYHTNLSDAQKIRITDNGDGTFKIQSKVRGLCLDCENGSTAKGTNVRWAEDNGTAAQKWEIHKSGEGCRIEMNKDAADMMLDCVNGGVADGTGVQLYPPNNTPAQLWYLIPVEGEDGYQYVLNAKSMKVLDVVNGGY